MPGEHNRRAVAVEGIHLAVAVEGIHPVGVGVVGRPCDSIVN